ncbi:MAG: glycosyltransferase family 2 protein [bacterium]
MKVIVIIPAFNEEESIELVLKDIPRELASEIIVVDNNSSDHTSVRAKRGGATVLSEPKRGYGRACLKAIDYAARLNPGVVVFLDADYSDYPDEMCKLLKKIEEGFDLVIGSRLRGNAEPGALLPQARFGNQLSVFLIKHLFGYQYTDLGPFRAIRWNELLKLNMSDKNFGWTVEMQIKAAKMKMNVTEVPVSYRKRIGVSKVSGTLSGTIKAGSKILYTIFKHAIVN